jgi:alanyl-tRNA synthetase
VLQVPNNYETDLIYPIIERAAQLAGVNYATANDNIKLYLKVNVTILLVPSFLRISILIFCIFVMYICIV